MNLNLQSLPSWETGQVILGDYLIEKELGRGGMGRVWLVKSNSTGRRFAVKQSLIKDDKHRKAFLAELQSWIDLPEHPNIVPCRFFRTVGDEIVIFADYIEGGSLADWIAKKKLTSLQQILDVAIQFAWGLQAIHERGLIHQDVKPSNVLMTADGVPMVTDFGLARARERATDGSFVSPALPPRQQKGVVSVGGMTPAYASPEQRAGQPLSRKTDIWSWGVSVLDMFIGDVSCPHGGQIAAEVLKEFVENGQQDDSLPAMPEKVVQVLRKCFAGNQTVRPGGLDETLCFFVHCFEDVTGQKYTRKRCHSNRRASIAMHFDHGGMNVLWRDPRAWLREAYIAAGRDPVESGRYQPPVTFSLKGTGVGALAIYEEAEREFEGTIRKGDTQYLQSLGNLLHDKTLLCIDIDDSTGAIVTSDRCISVYEQLLESERRSDLTHHLAVAWMTKAHILGSLGDMNQAVALYDRATKLLERLVIIEQQSDFSSELANCYMAMANAVSELGDPHNAISQYDQCIMILDRLVEKEGRNELAPVLARAYENKALAEQSLREPRKAVGLYDRCIDILLCLADQNGKGKLAAQLAGAYMNKANAVSDLGNSHESLGLYDNCIAIYERLMNENSYKEIANDLALAYTNKASVVRSLGDMIGAIKLYDCAIVIQERLVEQEGHGEFANYLAFAYLNKGKTIQKSGDLRMAIGLYDVTPQ